MERRPLARALIQDRFENFAVLARELAQMESHEAAYDLDLSDRAICGDADPSAIRFYSPSVMALANFLSGRFRGLSINMRLPEAESLNRQLARGGFFLAIARRSGSTRIENEPSEWVETMKSWNKDFHPSDCVMRRTALVDSKFELSPTRSMRAAFQKQLFSVIQPHMRKAVDVGNDMRPIASTWLTDRLSVSSDPEASTQIDDYLGAFQQIIANVCEHARIDDTAGGSSLAQIYATFGGGDKSQNRLQFMVIDNGYGLTKALPERYRDKPRNAAESLIDALMGNLPGFDEARGRGLKYVRDTARDNSPLAEGGVMPNRIAIITVGDALNSAAVINWSADSVAPSVEQFEGVPIRGTLVTVSLGLKFAPAVNDEVQNEELTMDFNQGTKSLASQSA